MKDVNKLLTYAIIFDSFVSAYVQYADRLTDSAESGNEVFV